MIAIDLSKQQALDADSKTKQQNDFVANLARDGSKTTFFIIEEAKETILHFSQGIIRILQTYFALIWYQYKITWYNTLNVNLWNLQLNKLKSWIKKWYGNNSKSFIKCVTNGKTNTYMQNLQTLGYLKNCNKDDFRIDF